MGIRRRIAWLILGALLCRLCVGCGEKEITGTEGIVALINSKFQSIEGRADSTHSLTGLNDVQNPLEEVAEKIQDSVEVASSSWNPSEKVVESTPQTSNKPVIVSTPGVTEMKVAETPIPKKNVTEAPILEAAATKAPIQEPAVTEIPISEISATKVPIRETSAIEAFTTEAPVTEPPVQEKPVIIPTALPTETPTTQIPSTEEDSHQHKTIFEKQEATCLSAGVQKEYCEECKQILTETIQEPLGHDFVKAVWELPTCQKGGYYNNICSRCGLVECVSQEALPHETEDITVQEGNCMEDTVVQHVCRICGMQTASETRFTPYDVHNWTVIEVDGVQISYCERCGVSK